MGSREDVTMLRLSQGRSGGRASAVLAAAAAVILAAAVGSGVASAAGISVKLAYNIAYDLSPIQIELDGGPSYAIYDFMKNTVAKGSVSGRKTVTFTPPKYGWYMVECGTEQNGAFTSGVGKFIGVTPKYPNAHTMVQGEMRGGWNDEALIAWAGLGLDRTNTRMGYDNANRVLADSKKYGTTLLMQFEGPPDANHVRDWVTRYKGKVKYWEVINEPNFTMGPDRYLNIIKMVYPIIKSIDPQAVVMGPATCGIMLGWNEAFLRGGGAQYIDALSIHDYEGDGNVDHFHYEWKLATLRKMMQQHGAGSKPIFQTERAMGAVQGGGQFCHGQQAFRLTMQRDLLEEAGIPNNHNSHYYANVTGYDGVPTFVYSESGPHSAALATRTRWAMIQGRKFVEKLDFGPTGNKILMGLRYEGKDGQTVTLRNFGCPDIPLDLGVSGGDSVEVVDCWGNVGEVPVKNGTITLAVTQMAQYLRLAPGQKVAAAKIDFGRNIMAQGKIQWSGKSSGDPKALSDGIFPIFHTDNPGGPTWFGVYPGKEFNEKPETLDILFDKTHPIDKVILWSAYADNPHCAVVAYDLQYWDGSKWATVEEVRVPCPPSDLVGTYLCRAASWWVDNNYFVHQFTKPVTTNKLRFVLRRITRGLFIDMIAERALWKAANEAFQIRELEIYEAGRPGTASGMASKPVAVKAAAPVAPTAAPAAAPAAPADPASAAGPTAAPLVPIAPVGPPPATAP